MNLSIAISLTGTAGQAFGAFVAHGISIDLVGEANDYVGKGLSGGRLVVRPSEKSAAKPEESIAEEKIVDRRLSDSNQTWLGKVVDGRYRYHWDPETDELIRA